MREPAPMRSSTPLNATPELTTPSRVRGQVPSAVVVTCEQASVSPYVVSTGTLRARLRSSKAGDSAAPPTSTARKLEGGRHSGSCVSNASSTAGTSESTLT